MKFIDKIIEKLEVKFTWSGNKKKVIKQKGGEFQVLQETNGVTNVFKVENLTVNTIQGLAGLNDVYDPGNFLKTVGQRFLAEQSVKQNNFKTIVEKAELPKIEDPKEVNQDWFLKWMDVSEGVNRESVQDILAKILSGEIKKPESFSLRTLETLRNLSRDELVLFQKFCDISYNSPQFRGAFTSVICEPFGTPGNNALDPFGLPYSALTILQDAGLIQGDLNAWFTFPIPALLQIPFEIGGSHLAFIVTADTKPSQHKMKVINFTSAGLELRSVLTLNDSPEYIAKFTEWVKTTLKMEPVDPAQLAGS